MSFAGIAQRPGCSGGPASHEHCRLWSINGLATELSIDRRTVGKKLGKVKPDGQIKGNPAWRLQTALAAINGKKPAQKGRHHWIEHFLCRVDEWEEIRLQTTTEWTLAEAAENFNLSEELLLDWIRAGMAFTQKGDWSTGEGFLVMPSQVIDWRLLMRALSIATSDPDFADEMGI